MSLTFLPLPDDRVQEAFHILQLVGQQLQALGRRQRISQISREAYGSWQDENANYVVTLDDEMVGLATLRQERLIDWPDFEHLGAVWMLRGLATHPDHRGRDIGAFAVRSTIELCPSGSLYLDCVSDFLPGYYEQLGFRRLTRQTRTYEHGIQYDITLMCRESNPLPELRR